MPQAEFVEERIRRHDGIPKLILDDPELLDYFVPLLRTDLKLLESYRYSEEAPLACPISAFGGTEDERVSKADLDLWAMQTTGAFHSQMFPGGHFFVGTAREAFFAALADVLGR